PPSDAPDWLLNLHDDAEGAEPMEDDSEEWAEPQERRWGRWGSWRRTALLVSLPAPSPVHQGALQALLSGLRADPEVGGALGAVGGVGRILQPPGHAHKEWLEPIGRALCDVITGEIACLRSRGDGDEDETSQRAELRETASDWLPELGVAMAREGVAGTGGGVAFPPRLFRRLLPSLLAALADPAHPGARSWAAAVIGQLGHALGAEATPFLPDLGPAFRLAAGDPDDEVRANAFYAIGRIGEAVGHAHREYPPIAGEGRGLGGDKPRPPPLNPAHRPQTPSSSPSPAPFLGPAFRLAAGDPDDEVRANAFYAIGRIGEAVGHAHREYPPIAGEGRGLGGLSHAHRP
ncbi:uncharacterized protein LOC120509806, partial [Passer montanus]|uniref:uncharacterized protein LOC120509806 n=1 Tax=Passer montanus TaxID=9160 RepID=UPI001960CD9A